MSPLVTRIRVAGFDAIALENARMRVVIIPSLGGRVWELLDRIRGRQWIWHRDGVALAVAPRGSIYDDVWSGGWEELFPNDAPGEFEGSHLPDHGEWWSSPWQVEETDDRSNGMVRLVADMRVRRAFCIKEFRLSEDGDAVQVSYHIESREVEGFHFLFKQHLPIALTPACKLVLPGGRVTAVDPSFGTVLPTSRPFDWPVAEGNDGKRVDLRRVPPPSSDGREFVYISGLPEGWCGVDDPVKAARLRLDFDTDVFPFLWMFLAYGGWQGCYTAVLEPCTNMPKDLTEAVRLGQSAWLAPGGIFRTQVTVTLGGT